MWEFHQYLLDTAPGPLRQAGRRITGIEVSEAPGEVEPSTDTAVQVSSLADVVPAGTWSGIAPGPPPMETGLDQWDDDGGGTCM